MLVGFQGNLVSKEIFSFQFQNVISEFLRKQEELKCRKLTELKIMPADKEDMFPRSSHSITHQRREG
jgi:hypothetical protein